MSKLDVCQLQKNEDNNLFQFILILHFLGKRFPTELNPQPFGQLFIIFFKSDFCNYCHLVSFTQILGSYIYFVKATSELTQRTNTVATSYLCQFLDSSSPMSHTVHQQLCLLCFSYTVNMLSQLLISIVGLSSVFGFLGSFFFSPWS